MVWFVSLVEVSIAVVCLLLCIITVGAEQTGGNKYPFIIIKVIIIISINYYFIHLSLAD